MTIERADKLTSPPIVGKYYLVTVIDARWHGNRSLWPVRGAMHEDKEIINFHHLHWHLDLRFLTKKQITAYRPDMWSLETFYSAPVMEKLAFSEPFLKRRMCHRGEPEWPFPQRDRDWET